MRHQHLEDEAGLSLIEVLIAVAIMGVLFVSVLGGLTTAILASDIHRKQATAETLLRSFAETIKAEPYDDDCSDYPEPSVTGYPHSISACSEDSPGLQRITLEVSSEDDRAEESIEILKRDAS